MIPTIIPTLPPIIMEVENDSIVEETSLVGTHSPLPYLREEEYQATKKLGFPGSFSKSTTQLYPEDSLIPPWTTHGTRTPSQTAPMFLGGVHSVVGDHSDSESIPLIVNP